MFTGPRNYARIIMLTHSYTLTVVYSHDDTYRILYKTLNVLKRHGMFLIIMSAPTCSEGIKLHSFIHTPLELCYWFT